MYRVSPTESRQAMELLIATLANMSMDEMMMPATWL